MSENNSSVQKSDSRTLLAIIISTVGIIGILAISILLMKHSGDKSFEAAQSIFNAVLPLIGTWIGAIIAYYFGTKQVETIQMQQENLSENLRIQSKENQELTRTMQETLTVQAEQIKGMSK